MDVQAAISKEEGWKRTVSVTVPAAEVESAFNVTAQKYRQKAKIPGFRPGKAPIEMVNRQFGEQIKQDVLEHMVSHAFDAALHKLSLSPLGTPELSSVQFERGAPLIFEADFEIRPQVEIKGYEGIPLTKRIYEVSEKDIGAALESLRDGAATTTEVQRPSREGDVIICDLQKIYDKLNRVKQSQFSGVRIELQAERTRPEFSKNLIGMSVGEGKEVEVSYPTDESDPDLAGNTVLYRAWLKQVLQKQLPPTDDELAKTVSGGRFATLAELREIIRKDLEHRAEAVAMRDLRGQIRRLVVQANPFEVPEGFLSEHLEEIVGRLQARDKSLSPDAIRTQFQPMAVEQFRWDYAVSEIAKREGIEVSDNDVDTAMTAWPPQSKDRPDRDKIHWNLMESKVYDWLMANAQITEEKFQPQSRIIAP